MAKSDPSLEEAFGDILPDPIPDWRDSLEFANDSDEPTDYEFSSTFRLLGFDPDEADDDAGVLVADDGDGDDEPDAEYGATAAAYADDDDITEKAFNPAKTTPPEPCVKDYPDDEAFLEARDTGVEIMAKSIPPVKPQFAHLHPGREVSYVDGPDPADDDDDENDESRVGLEDTKEIFGSHRDCDDDEDEDDESNGEWPDDV